VVKRLLGFTYGAICYLIFFATFLYAIAFVVNRVKPDSFGFSRDEIITSLALQPDSKIIVCGLSYSSAGPDTNSDFLVARFNSNGSFDAIFGGAW
jgi:hypothetical protein